MSPTRTIRAPKQASFCTAQFLGLFQKLGSASWTHSKIDNILYSRQSSQDNSQKDGLARGFPFTSNPETTIKPADQDVGSYIPGLNRDLFVAVVVSSVVVLSLAVFIPICCWRHRRRNRQMKQETLSAEENLKLPGLGEKDPPKQIYDAPRPDSTTLPIQGILMRIPVRGRRRETTESLGDMSNNFNEAISTKSTWSRPLNLNQQSRSSSTLGPASPPPAVLRFPTIASFNTNPVRLPTISSGPRPIIQFPIIDSLAPDSLPVSAVINGNQPARHSQVGLIINESSARNKLRKKTRPKLDQISEPNSIAPLSRISTFGGFGRASAGSTSNYWATWWESSGDEEEGDSIGIVKRNKRRL